ncbi:MAG TPA: response regulator [Phototrophicaceae bacterium]|nr:response regulator [Phototrophicaceae bacterium]
MSHILLIEDNQNNADYTIRILQGAGYEVEHYFGGLDGARAARRQRPDLILLDFNLPDIDGNVLILTLKKNLGGKAAPPIVAVTARNTAVDRQLAKSFGFDAFVGKPFEPEELLQIVKTLLPNSRLSL